MRNQGRVTYLSNQGKSSETYSYYHVLEYDEPICWQKYPEKSSNTQKKIEQNKKTKFSYPMSNGKKNGSSFNLVSQLVRNPFYNKNSNPFDFFYKEKVTNIYVIQMEQKQIVDSGASNHIASYKKCLDPDFYETYNVD